MNIRFATWGDEPALFELHQAAFMSHIEAIWGWNEDWQRKNFKAELESTVTSVVENQGVIIGYMQIKNEGSHIYLQNIALVADSQKKGLGTKLVKELQYTSAVQSIPLQLSVFRTNTLAQKFYERLGFRRTRETKTHVEMSWKAT